MKDQISVIYGFLILALICLYLEWRLNKMEKLISRIQ